MTIYPTQQEIRDAVRAREGDGFKDLNSQHEARAAQRASIREASRAHRAQAAADVDTVLAALAGALDVPVSALDQPHTRALAGQVAHEARRIAHAAQR